MTQLNPTLSIIWKNTYVTARRAAIAVIGATVILFGVILIFTPGPAIVVIPLGLAILATEFVWARRLLNRVRDNAQGAFASFRQRINQSTRRSAASESSDDAADQPDARSS